VPDYDVQIQKVERKPGFAKLPNDHWDKVVYASAARAVLFLL
jgi:hypothetical protein